MSSTTDTSPTSLTAVPVPSSTSWATPEPHELLWFEQTNNAAVYVGAVAYGIHMMIYSASIYVLLGDKKNRKRNGLWVLFNTILFALGTVNICLNINFNELAWIDDRNYPGGPLAFLLEQQARPTNTAGNSVAMIISFMADGLLLYRCYKVWRKWYIMIIPSLMWLAASVLSALVVFQAARPTSSLWANNTIVISIPYWSLSIALTLVLTSLLIIRLMYIRHTIVSSLGKQHGDTYASIAAILFESALPYGIVSLIFIVLYGLQNTAENLFIPLLVQVECISPMLIIIRVCRGRAMDNELLSKERMTEIKFNNGSSGGSSRSDELSEMAFQSGALGRKIEV